MHMHAHTHTPSENTLYLVKYLFKKLLHFDVSCSCFCSYQEKNQLRVALENLNRNEKSMSGMMQCIMYRNCGVFYFSQKAIVSCMLCAGDILFS